MNKATLAISLPPIMKEFIGTKLREGRFSTPSEYIRSLIRDDQDLEDRGEMVAILRRASQSPPGTEGARMRGKHQPYSADAPNARRRNYNMPEGTMEQAMAAAAARAHERAD